MVKSLVYEYYQYLHIESIIDSLDYIIEDIDDSKVKGYLEVGRDNLLEINDLSSRLESIVVILDKGKEHIINTMFIKYMLSILIFIESYLNNVSKRILERSEIQKEITEDSKYLNELLESERF